MVTFDGSVLEVVVEEAAVAPSFLLIQSDVDVGGIGGIRGLAVEVEGNAIVEVRGQQTLNRRF